MLGLCFHYDPKRDKREQWAWIASWFSPDTVWEIDQPVVLHNESKFLPLSIKSVAELPSTVPLVVSQPQEGKYVQGQECIDDFEHPEDAIYYFGYDHSNMMPIERDYQSVYIPTKKYELYSAFAAVILLNDRRAKWAA